VVIKSPQYGQILAGKKTMLRKPAELGQDCTYKVGQSYPVRKAIREPQGVRIKVVSTRREMLSRLSYPDALREGFRTRNDYFDWWRDHYGTGPLMAVRVWVVEFAIDTEEQPRLLARQHGKKNPPSYVTSRQAALPDEPEAIPASWQDYYSKIARDNAPPPKSQERKRWRDRGEIAKNRRLANEREEVDVQGLRLDRAGG
jgi:hypothetical protein